MQTLNQIQRTLKKLNKQITLHKSFTKEGQTNNILKRLEETRESLIKVLETRTNPENAHRCALPKRIQRQKGLLPAI